MNVFLLSFPFEISNNFFSHEAVSSGVFKSTGTKSNNCLPFDVIYISLFFFSIKNELNNFSIISALVATVPRPFFSIAVNNVPSFKYGGGFVFPEVIFNPLTLSTSFSKIFGILSYSSSSSISL